MAPKKKTKPSETAARRMVLVTTTHRGVFAGDLEALLEETDNPTRAVLTGARNVISWSADMRGVLGLASIGPSESCKIGAKVERLRLYDITAIVDIGEEATAKWDALK